MITGLCLSKAGACGWHVLYRRSAPNRLSGEWQWNTLICGRSDKWEACSILALSLVN